MEDRTLVTRVILVRHGQSTYNAQSRIQGRSDHSTLTPEGLEMAHRAGKVLQSIGFDAVYTSPLQRAYTTAETIVSYLPSPTPSLQVEPNLMEINLPLWEGLTRQAVKRDYAEQYRLWQEHPEAFYMDVPDGDVPDRDVPDRDVPDGERTQRIYPVTDLHQQAAVFWQAVIPRHAGKTILIVAHNGILRSLISVALGVPPSYYTVIRQSNCGISVLNFSGLLGDGVQLESLNLTDPVGEKLPDRRDQTGVRLLLVRHGETQWNREQRFQGQIDVPLNENGLAQADKVAQFLADVPLDFAITSPLLRPKQTAEAIVARHPGVELTDEPGLLEIGHGRWEGKLESEIVLEYGDLLAAWKAHPETVQMPDGENLQQVWERSVAAWERIVENAPAGSTGLVVAHDAVNKVILCSVLGLAPKDIWAIKQGNGGVTVVDYSRKPNSKPVLQAMNITTHFGRGVLDQTAAGAL